MIAMRAGLTFQDFLRWASPISLGALLVTIPLSLLYYSKEIREWKRKMKGEDLGREAEFKKSYLEQLSICLILFIGTISGLVLHASLEKILGLQKNALLIYLQFY
jgi:Na+/H+ antiporter NhaD/arsenite permease-like protein